LIKAADKGHEACVRVLIAAKANFACASHYGWTALHNAAYKGHASICRMLVDEGASLTAVNSENHTPLELAKKQGKAKCVAILEAPTAAAKQAIALAVAEVRKIED